MVSWTSTQWIGVIAVFVFYLLILVVGMSAAWYKTKRHAGNEEETAILAGRHIGLAIGVFTMIATWVGGGYINGTAEVVYTSGLLHAQAPIGYSISLVCGGIFFARIMRERRYTTMIDPFQEKYGIYVGSLAYFPALCGELLWSVAILNALGSSVSVVLNVDMNYAVIISACIAVAYTFFGGLYAVAYTDVVQLICIAFGLVIIKEGIYGSNRHDHVELNNLTLRLNNTDILSWLGTIESSSIGTYIDSYLLLICGGIPWQVYFQRVLTAKTPQTAQILSIAGGIGCVLLSIPAILIGLIAKATDWNAVGVTKAYVDNNSAIVLPEVLHKLTPPAVMFFGLGAVSAAVMSSSDSSILSASSMFAHNIYKGLIRNSASTTETVIVLRLSMIVVGALACSIGLTVKSVYALFYLCSDLVYVLLFPQLVGVIRISFVNSYGVVGGMASGLLIRLLLGEKALGLPPVLQFGGNFPGKTVAMLFSFGGMFGCSLLFDQVPALRRADPIGYFKSLRGSFFFIVHCALPALHCHCIAIAIAIG